MELRKLAIEGVFEVRPCKHLDQRGYFSEIFRADEFEAKVGRVAFVQDNQSLSVKPGTLRGIHFQTQPCAQGKLVRCLAGKVFDLAVDLRNGSPTFGQWASIVLSADDNNQLWIPVGFGHAFCTLEPNSVLSYRVTNYYSPANDKGVAWDDPDLAVSWPDIADPDTLSEKDRQQPKLRELPTYFSVSD